MADPARTIALQRLVEALQAGCERPFSEAHSMPPGVYTSRRIPVAGKNAISSNANGSASAAQAR